MTKKPDYSKRVGGGFLLFMAIIGLIATSPLVGVGAFFGSFAGLFFGSALSATYLGARIGSLGFIELFLYSLGLTEATIEEPLTKPLVIEPDESLDEDADIDDETRSPEPEPEPGREPEPEPEQEPEPAPQPETPRPKPSSPTFQDIINDYIAQDEAGIVPNNIEGLRIFTDNDIEKFIGISQNLLSSPADFWDGLKAMTPKDVQVFVEKLSSKKELDNLWFRFKGVEQEPSKLKIRQDKFALILSLLSEEQLKTSFSATNFLNIFNVDAYVTIAANTLNRTQLATFAKDFTYDVRNQQVLNAIIIKLQPGPTLLGKLVSILPYATEIMKVALIEQIAHLQHPASFNVELSKLAQHHIDLNKQSAQANRDTPSVKPKPSTPSRWAPVQAGNGPQYADNAPLEKKPLSEDEFGEFIKLLNGSFLLQEQKLTDILSRLPDEQVKMMVAQASLANLWALEAKVLNQKKLLDSRRERLKIVLENLSDAQFKSALRESKFWEIFRNTQDHFCDVAAQVLTPQQFVTIITDAPLERQEDLGIIIGQISKDSPADKIRLTEIIEAVLPKVTPKFGLALEKQIKNILSFDRAKSECFTKALKEYLNPEVQSGLTLSP